MEVQAQLLTWRGPIPFDWLRHATGWQRVSRLVPLSWILLLAWPLTVLLVRPLPEQDLTASLLGVAALTVLWTWFWLQPKTGQEYGPSAVALIGLIAIGSALTFTSPYVWHDGVLGFAMVAAGTWPSWRPTVLAIPAVTFLILLSMLATGGGTITALGVALVWFFLGIAIFTVQRLFNANLRLQESPTRQVGGSTSHAEKMELSPRQTQIIHLVAIGLSDKEIAARLQVSPHTIRTHLQRLYLQHDLRNRAEAAATWIKHNPNYEEDAASS